MSSNRSPSIQSIADLLAGLLLLILFFPWLSLGESISQISFDPLLYLRLLLILSIAKAISMKGLLWSRAIERERKSEVLLAGALALTGIFTVLSLILLPLLYTTGVDSYWPIYLLLGFLSWLFGIYWGQNPFDNQAMQRQMVLGAFSLVLFFSLVKRWGLLEELLHKTLPFIILWFLGVIITTILTQLLGSGLGDREKNPSLSKYWPPLLASLALLTLFIALLFSLTSPYIIGLLRTPALLLLRILEYGFLGIAYVLAFIAQGVFYLLQRLLKSREVEFEPPEPLESGPISFEGEALERTPVSGDSLYWIASILLGLITIGITLYYLLRERRGGEEEEEKEIRESYASLDVLKDWALLKMNGVKNAMLKRRDVFTSLLKRYTTAVEIYHHVLKKTAEKGAEKPEEMTAHRFQPQVNTSFPGHRREAEKILKAFSQELYRGDTTSQENLLTLKEDLKRMEEER